MNESPRQFALSHEAEARRKRNALEKAKANYLCTQLRLRLQYAKLKVDHGWQRQTLNEVENLYFRHSHASKRRPSLNPIPSPSSNLVAEGPTSLHHSIQEPPQMPDPERAPLSPRSEGCNNRPSSTSPTHEPARTTLLPSPANSEIEPQQAEPASLVSTPLPTHTHSPTAKGKERDFGWYSPVTNEFRSAETNLTSPLPVHSPPSQILRPRNESPEQSMFSGPPPFTSSLYSSAKYLSNTYISSSPFPINMPITGSGSPPSSTFDAKEQPLTYDSFWSSHSTWSSHAAIANTQTSVAMTGPNYSAPSVTQS